MLNGIINVYKELGYTSFDVIAKLRGILKQKKIGHTGTLDPNACGVLPVCLGNGTKLCDMLTDKDKTYETVMHLGITTDTQDITGEIIKEQDVNIPKEQVIQAVMSFVGTYDQLPPMYSALKVNGQKLCDLARKGIEVERKTRPVTIHSIDIKEVNLPFITMSVSCSKGTYIRTLCHDIGIKLGCGACVETLKRTQVSMFDIDNSLTLEQIEKLVQEGKIEGVIQSVDSMFMNLGSIVMKSGSDRLIMNGNKFHENDIDSKTLGESDFRVYFSDGTFAGIYEFVENANEYKPVKMFLS